MLRITPEDYAQWQRDAGLVTVHEDELIQAESDQAVLLLAIDKGYLTDDEAAQLQLEIR